MPVGKGGGGGVGENQVLKGSDLFVQHSGNLQKQLLFANGVGAEEEEGTGVEGLSLDSIHHKLQHLQWEQARPELKIWSVQTKKAGRRGIASSGCFKV